jgi:ADP-heptose:LPS heptosyltransferase
VKDWVEYMKVLILRFSSIGDIVLTTPVVRAIKTQLPEVQLHYAVKEQYRSLLEANPYIDRIHVLGDSLSALLDELRQEQFDFVVDLHHNLRTLRVKKGLHVSSASFLKLNLEKWLLVNFKINRLPAVHIVDRYFEAAKPLGVKPDSLGLDYFIPERDEMPLDWLPPEFRDGYVALAIGAQHETKKLPVKRLIELCDKINRPLVVLGGREDAAVGEEIERFFARSTADSDFEPGLKELGKRTVVFNGCGKFNLNQSASLVRQSRYVFSHDTGLMHIAAAFRKEIFSIWGNTVPAFGMYPYRTRFTILENTKISCRPCSKIGYQKCPKGHFKCMNELVFDFYLPWS